MRFNEPLRVRHAISGKYLSVKTNTSLNEQNGNGNGNGNGGGGDDVSEDSDNSDAAAAAKGGGGGGGGASSVTRWFETALVHGVDPDASAGAFGSEESLIFYISSNQASEQFPGPKVSGWVVYRCDFLLLPITSYYFLLPPITSYYFLLLRVSPALVSRRFIHTPRHIYKLPRSPAVFYRLPPSPTVCNPSKFTPCNTIRTKGSSTSQPVVIPI